MLDYRSFLIDAYRLVTTPARAVYSHRSARKSEVPVGVLFYHRVSDELVNPWTMTEQDFLRQVDWLQKHFDLISLDEVQRRMREGNDRPAISITFDDGYADNCNWALPMLLQRNIPVTYFVASGHIASGKPFAHDAEQGQTLRPNSEPAIRALSQAGVEIGAHTRNHVDLGQIDDEQVLFDEVVAATRELEKLIERPVRYFAFPFGKREHLNSRVFEMAREHGFAGVCSTFHEWNQIGADPFHIRRFHGDANLSRLKNWLTFDPRNVHKNSPHPFPDVDITDNPVADDADDK